MLMNPSCNRLSLRQATRRVTQLCDQALAPLDLRATQLSMLREIDRLGPIALNPLAEDRCPLVACDRPAGDGRRELLDVADEPRHQPGPSRLASRLDRPRSVDVLRAGERGGLPLHAVGIAKGRALPARAWKLWRKAQAVLG